jgi:hypothetical protein
VKFSSLYFKKVKVKRKIFINTSKSFQNTNEYKINTEKRAVFGIFGRETQKQ